MSISYKGILATGTIPTLVDVGNRYCGKDIGTSTFNVPNTYTVTNDTNVILGDKYIVYFETASAKLFLIDLSVGTPKYIEYTTAISNSKIVSFKKINETKFLICYQISSTAYLCVVELIDGKLIFNTPITFMVNASYINVFFSVLTEDKIILVCADSVDTSSVKCYLLSMADTILNVINYVVINTSVSATAYGCYIHKISNNSFVLLCNSNNANYYSVVYEIKNDILKLSSTIPSQVHTFPGLVSSNCNFLNNSNPVVIDGEIYLLLYFQKLVKLKENYDMELIQDKVTHVYPMYLNNQWVNFCSNKGTNAYGTYSGTTFANYLFANWDSMQIYSLNGQQYLRLSGAQKYDGNYLDNTAVGACSGCLYGYANSFVIDNKLYYFAPTQNNRNVGGAYYQYGGTYTAIPFTCLSISSGKANDYANHPYMKASFKLVAIDIPSIFKGTIKYLPLSNEEFIVQNNEENARAYITSINLVSTKDTSSECVIKLCESENERVLEYVTVANTAYLSFGDNPIMLNANQQLKIERISSTGEIQATVFGYREK